MRRQRGLVRALSVTGLVVLAIAVVGVFGLSTDVGMTWLRAARDGIATGETTGSTGRVIADPEGQPVRGGGVVIEGLPVGGPPARGDVVSDLAPLRRLADGDTLLAAARFSPPGATFPSGIDVTWPLSESREPGSRLVVVHLDESAGRWLDTRHRAVVDETGTRATGKVFHFSTAGVSTATPKVEDEATPRVVKTVADVKAPGVHAEKVSSPKLDAVRTLYEKQGGKAAPMTEARMKALYQAGDFSTVKTLIEAGAISTQHSMDMADVRIKMCIETFQHIVRNEGKGKWRIYRSDSGNQKAGSVSDIDQTASVMEFKDGRWVRAEALDGVVGKLFTERFATLHSLGVSTLDIATIAGRDKPPEWRTTSVQLEVEGKREFAQHSRETMFTLRRTPGAYTFTGAIVQQMQLRVLDLIERNLAAGKDGGRPAEPRPIHSALEAHSPGFKLNNLVCMMIGPGDGADDTVKAREVFREDAVRIMFDGLKPKLVRGHAYDAAVANYFEYMHHLADRYPAVKYHLRALDDGLQAIERLKKGVARFEYANLHSSQRAEHLADLLGKDLAVKQWDGRSFIDRWKVAFDISAKLREHHSNKTLNDTTYADSMAELVKELYRDKADPKNPEQIERARAEYDRRCQEFMLHNMIQTSEHRIVEFLKPAGEDAQGLELFRNALDEGALRKQLGLEHPIHDTKWKAIREEMVRNYGEQARNQLLYSFRELRNRPDVLKMILDRAEKRGFTPEQVGELRKVVAESASNGLFFGAREFVKFPKTYLRYAQLAAARSAEYYAKQAFEGMKRETFFAELPDVGPTPVSLLKSVGFGELHSRVERHVNETKFLKGMNRRFGAAFFQVGSVQGAVNVLRAYSESDGDPTATTTAAIKESLLLLFPNTGLAYSSYEAGADWSGQTLVVAPILAPVAGHIVLAYTIGEAGLAIYEHEYSTPLKYQTADALYRGYVGPSLYEFSAEGKAPPFTEDDEAKLTLHQKAIAEVTRRIAAGESSGDPRVLAVLGRDAKILEMKKAAWLAYKAEDNRYQGAVLSGKGRHLEQKVLELRGVSDPLFKDEPIGAPGSLLARVVPVIFYSRNPNEGAVEFDAPAPTPAERARLAEIERTLPGLTDPMRAIEIEHEAEILAQRIGAWERAQRYLAAAAKNHELMLQIRRDSLWPSMLRDRGIASMAGSRNFVETWLVLRRDFLPDAMKAAGIDDGLKPWDERVREELTTRLLEDIARSKSLWTAQETLRTARAAREPGELDRRRGALAAEMLIESVRQGVTAASPELRDAVGGLGSATAAALSSAGMGRTIAERNIPFAEPEVEVRIRALPFKDDVTKMNVKLAADVKVTADPDIYRAPYFSVPYILDPKQSKEALAAGTWLGLPLDDGMKKALRAHVAQNESMLPTFDAEKDPFNPLMLVFVFCSAVEIPERIVAETTESLPRLAAYDIRMPDGMAPLPTEHSRGFLFGGAAGAPKEEALANGPLAITLRRFPETGDMSNVVEIRSEALAKLDPADSATGYRYRIYRAFSADGPFEAVGEYFTRDCFGATPIVPGPPDRMSPAWRLARDRFAVSEHVTPVHHMDRQKERRPAWYRIGQTPVRRDSDGDVEEAGKEVLSPPGGTSGEAVIFLRYNRDEAGLPRHSDASIQVGALLGLADQWLEVPDAYLVVEHGGRTLHVWGSGFTFFPEPGGGPVRISATGGGLSATASFDVPPSAERIASVQSGIAARAKQLAEREISVAEQVEFARTRLAELRKSSDPRPADGRFGSWAGGRLRTARDIWGARNAVEYEGPQTLAAYRRSLATAGRDWAAARAQAEAELLLVNAYDDAEKEYIAAVTALRSEVESASTPDDTTRQQKEAFLRDLATAVPTRAGADGRRFSALDHLEYLAVQMGDPAAYERSVEARVALITEPQALAGIYGSAARTLVALGGSRSKAAAWHTLSRDASIRARPQDAEKIRAQWEQSKPLWWP